MIWIIVKGTEPNCGTWGPQSVSRCQTAPSPPDSQPNIDIKTLKHWNKHWSLKHWNIQWQPMFKLNYWKIQWRHCSQKFDAIVNVKHQCGAALSPCLRWDLKTRESSAALVRFYIVALNYRVLPQLIFLTGFLFNEGNKLLQNCSGLLPCQSGILPELSGWLLNLSRSCNTGNVQFCFFHYKPLNLVAQSFSLNIKTTMSK